ncbi:hypothetical protein GA0070606_0022 [Micromonospora citrea]|uniref:Uncharacterized protein n=1 Tax=Micromonospora citrea TaxID=47855 RepID=A0A1C6TQC8_9ACTN|nr:hypothetical protein [Micromonospora citrea]SCL43831.1 hypothetical protein GA0070606_0022 [Micromonospora citrea]
MTSTEWVPLSRRRAGLEPEPPVEGVPPYLEHELQTWLRGQFFQHDGLQSELRLRLRRAGALGNAKDDELLDVVDAVLFWHPWSVFDDGEDVGIELTPEQEREYQEELQMWQHIASQVREILDMGGSSWRVNRTLDGLERRLDDTVTAAVDHARGNARDDAADHLAAAWRAAYGRNPDADKAYDEAVLAVEAVACPVVSPRNPRPTLGTVIRDLRNQESQWELAIGDSTGAPAGIGRLVDMMALLWEGQSRHAGSPNSRRQSQVEGESAVHLAATIVQWLNSGVLRRKP